MNKQLTILLLVALFAVQTAAEDCKDHPWSKKDRITAFRKKLNVPTDDADWNRVEEVFKKDSTATDSTNLDATVHPAIPAEIITSDVTTCCTKEVYDSIVKMPLVIDGLAKARRSNFEKVLGGLPKGLKQCGKRNNDGEGFDGEFEQKDPAKLSILQILSMIKVKSATPGDSDTDTTEEGVYVETTTTTTTNENDTTNATADGGRRLQETNEEEYAIKFLKQFFIAKAKILKAWVQFQRGSLMILCRKPSKAVEWLSGATETGALTPNKAAWETFIAEYKTQLLEIRTAQGGLANAIKYAFMALGDKGKCQGPATRIMKQLAQSGPCGKGQCKGFFESGIKPRPLSFKLLKFLFSKPEAKPEFEGDINNKPPTLLRRLQTDDETDTQDAEPVATGGTTSVSDSADDEITGGGPFKPDGTCVEAGCDADFQPSEEGLLSESGHVTSDGQNPPVEEPAVAEGNSVILSIIATLVGLIAIL